jgi:hypothetical protein
MRLLKVLCRSCMVACLVEHEGQIVVRLRGRGIGCLRRDEMLRRNVPMTFLVVGDPFVDVDCGF